MTQHSRDALPLRQRVLAWHRRMGLLASALVVVVVITGFPLNHVDGLGLDHEVVTSEALLDWYGMKPQAAPVGYRLGTDWLISLQGALYLNDRYIGDATAGAVGAVMSGDFLVVALPRRLLLFGKDGRLVEKLSGAGLPGPISAIGLGEAGRIVLRTPGGRFSGSDDFLDWTPGAATVDWARPAAMPSELRAAILESYRGAGLPWSRVLLDLHTGRILGAWGPYLIDGAGLSLLVLVGTGIFNWFGRRR